MNFTAPVKKHRRPVVLLIEPNLDLLEVTYRWLQRWGYDAVPCPTRACLQKLSAVAEFDLVLADITPGTGLECVLMLRASGFRGPMIGCTADPSPGNRRPPGCSQVLLKPLAPEALKLELQGALQPEAQLVG